MVRNNFREDIKELCELEGIPQAEAGRRSGIDRADVRHIGSYKMLPDRFVRLCEAIGYDIEVIYHRREDADSWGE